jgi:hypothetical protein
LAYGHCPGEVEEDVDMVFRRIDENGQTPQVLEYARYISMERFPDRIVQDRGTMFGAENEVDVKTGERLRHDFRSPLQGCYVFAHTQGVALGWDWVAPLGLNLQERLAQYH